MSLPCVKGGGSRKRDGGIVKSKILSKNNSMQNELANLEEKRGQKDSFLRAVRRFMEMKTLNPIILKELIEKIEVYHVEDSGKNKTQRIVIHYRFVGCLTIPEWYRKRRVSLESRSGVEVNFLTTAV